MTIIKTYVWGEPVEEDCDCVYVVPSCDSEDTPVVSSECGYNDQVVRGWRSFGTQEFLGEPVPRLVTVCEETRYQPARSTVGARRIPISDADERSSQEDESESEDSSECTET